MLPNVTRITCAVSASGSSGSYVPVILCLGYILDGLPEIVKEDTMDLYA